MDATRMLYNRSINMLDMITDIQSRCHYETFVKRGKRAWACCELLAGQKEKKLEIGNGYNLNPLLLCFLKKGFAVVHFVCLSSSPVPNSFALIPYLVFPSLLVSF
ncbi:hypothetical protein L6452_13613 [Arctium lappa]|uniref:Uncharacterized protein n=1 Tax=Arctium lappa TaxID=4217 RepID=A0ACB9CJ05_ARCLA|nr:hypothetical protein L6452_13613 [Arctium lappa]